MAARGGTLAFQHARPSWERRQSERTPHERPLGVAPEFDPYRMRRGGELGTTVLGPTEAQLRTRGLVLAGLILAGSLGLGILTAKISMSDDE